jgi:hypothetical protein
MRRHFIVRFSSGNSGWAKSAHSTVYRQLLCSKFDSTRGNRSTLVTIMFIVTPPGYPPKEAQSMVRHCLAKDGLAKCVFGKHSFAECSAKFVVFTALLAGTLVFLPRPTFAQAAYSPNQLLPLPQTAGSLPISFIVRGLEPSNRTDNQGTIYVATIRGVPGGVDLHRWSPVIDGPPNANGTLPFRYLGQPDGCGIFATGCQNIGIAEGGGDVDIAVNSVTLPGVPNLGLTSLTLAPGITSTQSVNRGHAYLQPTKPGHGAHSRG